MAVGIELYNSRGEKVLGEGVSTGKSIVGLVELPACYCIFDYDNKTCLVQSEQGSVHSDFVTTDCTFIPLRDIMYVPEYRQASALYELAGNKLVSWVSLSTIDALRANAYSEFIPEYKNYTYSVVSSSELSVGDLSVTCVTNGVINYNYNNHLLTNAQTASSSENNLLTGIVCTYAWLKLQVMVLR